MGWSQTFSVSGVIKDESNTPVAFANILMLNAQDSTIVSGTTSEYNGTFSFETVLKGNYIIKTSFVGYKDNTTSISVVSEDLKNLNIILKENVEALDAVEIVAKKPTIKIESGRLIYNVENSSLSEGNILQVLRSTPRVLVADDIIKIKNTPTTVYINDKKVNLTGSELAQFLESTPANTVTSIEVITNPSAKYDADNGVVLNIIMSRNLITGYRGSVFANYTQGVFPRTNYGITQFYKNSKINVFASYNYGKNKINRDDEQRINYFDNNGIVNERWVSNLGRATNSETHNYNLNFDYFINDNNTLSFSANGQILPYFEYETLGNSVITDNANNLLFRFDSENQTRDERYNLSFDGDYIHEFKNKSKLLLNVNYTNYDYDRNQNVNSEYFSAVNVLDSITAFNTLNNQDTEFFIYKADYILPFNEDASFEAGVKVSNIESNSDITQNDIDNGIEILDINNTDVFTYDENIYAAYLNLDKTWGKWNFNAGLRFEHTDIEAESILLGDVNTQEYSELFPTTNLTYQISDKVNIYTNYKRSLQRPNYQSLNPFRFFLTDNIIVSGNPNLQPVFENIITLGSSFLDHFAFEAYYSKSDDNIIEIPIQDNNNNNIVFTQTNLGNTTEISFYFEAFFDIAKWWSFYFVTSVFNVEEESSFSGQTVNQNRWTNFYGISNVFSFLEDNSLNASFSVNYISSSLQGLRVTDDRLLSDLSISKSIFKGKAIVSLSVEDLFNEQDFFNTTRFLDQDNTMFTNVDNRTIKFGLRYNFGNTKLKTNERIKTLEEKNRLQRNN